MDLIDRLAGKVGFYESYSGTFGEQVTANVHCKTALLSAMGYQLDHASIESTLSLISQSSWQNILSPSHIIKLEEQQPFVIISLPDTAKPIINWVISGNSISGTAHLKDLQRLEEKKIDDTLFIHYKFFLPKLKQGYYQLAIEVNNQQAKSDLIVAPKHCFSHESAVKHKVWGYTAQLYSLRSNKNWGIGDFSDLLDLCTHASQQGASLVGLNPLHALFKHNPAHKSPYSPSSRQFLNPIYIDVTAIDNYDLCKDAQVMVKSDAFQERLTHIRNSSLVDYTAVADIKYEIIELLFTNFCLNKSNSNENKYALMLKEFEQFKHDNGQELYQFSTFDAFYEHFNLINNDLYGWHDWPTEYQNPENDSVKNLQNTLANRIEFFSFLQWLAHKQLLQAADHAKQNMNIGLYLDLAVGCDGSGADVWSNQAVYVAGASIGAPPDNLNALGQNWGLTPINPITLKTQGYQPLIKALRSLMQFSGAIRIDHILGLMRQYWVAENMAATDGIYIDFPFDDILRVIALESCRNKCVVIGEDLGNVPSGFSEKINNVGLLSFKVLFFERWENGLFKRPDNFPARSVSTVSTHDTPTLTGWWQGNDLLWRQQLNLYPNEQAGEADRNARIGDRANLIAALQDWQVIDINKAPEQNPPMMNTELSISVQKFLADSPSHIQLISIEDALEVVEQVNIPGTIDEHPNWLQKLPIMLEDFSEIPSVEKITQSMRAARPNNK